MEEVIFNLVIKNAFVHELEEVKFRQRSNFYRNIKARLYSWSPM